MRMQYRNIFEYAFLILVPCLVVYFSMIYLGIGDMGPSIVAGILFLAITSFVLFALKVLVLDKFKHNPMYNTLGVAVFTCILATLLRLYFHIDC